MIIPLNNCHYDIITHYFTESFHFQYIFALFFSAFFSNFFFFFFLKNLFVSNLIPVRVIDISLKESANLLHQTNCIV